MLVSKYLALLALAASRVLAESADTDVGNTVDSVDGDMALAAPDELEARSIDKRVTFVFKSMKCDNSGGPSWAYGNEVQRAAEMHAATNTNNYLPSGPRMCTHVDCRGKLLLKVCNDVSPSPCPKPRPARRNVDQVDDGVANPGGSRV
jgi:hypothetical protein